MDTSVARKVYLWSVPRSLSTAFLRSMSTIPKSKCFHQPYVTAHFKDDGRILPEDTVRAPSETYEDIRGRVQGEFPGYELVFIKELAKNLVDKLDDNSYIPPDCTHTFLIRHPARIVSSYIRTLLKVYQLSIPDEREREEAVSRWMTPEKIQGELSLQHLYKVYDTVVNTYGMKPIIFDADDLQKNPEGTLRAYCREVGFEYRDSMVNWGPVTPHQMQIWQHRLDRIYNVSMTFLGGAINGTKLIQSDLQEPNMADVDEKYRGLVEENLPIFEQLRRLKIEPLRPDEY